MLAAACAGLTAAWTAGVPELPPLSTVPGSPGLPGKFVWADLVTDDSTAAQEFYRSVADYEIIENTAANRLSDFVLVSQGYARATVPTIPQAQDKVRPTWLLFVRVKDVGEAVEKTEELGGQVLIDPKPQLLEGGAVVIAEVGVHYSGLMLYGKFLF